MAKGTKLPTLADVARAAEVSTATVSRCLNAPDRVVEETRARVLAAVQALGYTPNFGAKVLAARHTNTIGAVIPTMENAVFARGLQAFQEELRMNGKTLLLASCGYQQDLEDEQVRALVARGADALMLIGFDRTPSLYDFVDRHGIPTLVTWSHDPAQGRPSIGFDNRAAMAELAGLVLSLGHRRIGCISAPTATNDRARGRVEGVRLAMAAGGLAPDDLHLIETPYGIETGEAAFLHLMSEAPGTTAVICGNDVLAIGALRAAQTMGLSVPADVSVTGFDDIEIATLAQPALTTVHVPHREMGRRAARYLLDMLRTGSGEGNVLLQTEIRQRRSLGIAPPSPRA